MRVVVHHPARTEEDGTEVPESVSAYRYGRIEDFVNPLTGETTTAADVAEALLEQAHEEFPDLDVSLEHLHDKGDGTSEWRDEPPAAPAPPGEQVTEEFTVEQPTQVQP